MARTTSTQVIDLLGDSLTHTRGEGDYDGETDLTVFIETANLLVTRVIACATRKGASLDTDEAEMLERWLAAHFYVQRDQALSSKSNGVGSSGSFQGQTGMHLENSKYGQAAMAIDFTGCLRAVATRKTARLIWGGTPYRDRTTYQERNLD